MANFMDRVTLHAMGGNGGNGVASMAWQAPAGPDGRAVAVQSLG